MSLLIKIKKFLENKNTNFVHLETVDSTMKEIKKYIGNKNICMIADKQTDGVGRRGNYWISPKGNIYLSFLFNYNLSIEEHFFYTAVTVNSVCLCLKNFINENINIKWPNDININDSKVAGIMTEIIEHNKEKYIIIGLGINVKTSPELKDYKTCCLYDFNFKNKNEELTLNFLKIFYAEYQKILKKDYNSIIQKFKSKMINIDKKITLLLPDGDKQNVFLRNLNFDGSILIEKDGKKEVIYSARIKNDFN